MGLNYTAPSFVGGLPTAMALTQAFADIEAALGRAVSIDGVSPNAMEEDFDLNGHSLLNVGNVDDLFDSAETTALATRLTAAELALDLFQVSQDEQDAVILTNSNNITSNDTDITSLLSEVTALVLSQATQDLLLQSHTADLVTINTRAQAALDKAALNEASLLALAIRVNDLELAGGTDLTGIQAQLDDLAALVESLHPDVLDVGLSSSVSGDTFSVTATLDPAGPLALFYREVGSTTWIPRLPAETSDLSSHTQSVSGLVAGDYEYYVESNGVLSSIGTFAIAVTLSGWVDIPPTAWTEAVAANTAVYSSDYTGESDFLADGTNTDAFKITVDQAENYGASMLFDLPGKPQEVKFRYKVFLPVDHETYWNSSDSNLKMPGIIGKVSDLNGGNGGSQSSYLDIPYRAPSARLQLHRPDPSFGLAYGGEKYWQGSTNDDARLNLGGFPWQFGDTFWADDNNSASAAPKMPVGAWFNVESRMKMNTPGVADGELELVANDTLDSGSTERYLDTGFEWVEPFPGFQALEDAGQLEDWDDQYEMFQIPQVWLDVYHGGADKVTAGELTLYIRDFQYEVVS